MRYFRNIFMLLLTGLTISTVIAQNTVRYATQQDVAAIPNANLGDLIISGGTEMSNGLPAIWIGSSSGWTIAPGKKILIKGAVYDWIAIANTSAGTAKDPIVITNYGGQVETQQLVIKGMRYFKLTGKYDPVNKTGDINYPGHANGYAYTQGKYGFFINNKWQSTDAFLLEISGLTTGGVNYSTSDYEVEFLESGNGGYTNAFKYNSQTGIVDNVKIHDNYIHDTGGEGIYLGNTDDPQAQVFRNLQIYNNRILRTGLDGLQANNIVDGSSIHNNVIQGSFGWRDAFMDTQDFGSSLSFNNGNSAFENNITIRGSGALFQVAIDRETSYPFTPTGTVKYNNNLFLNCIGPVGGYILRDNDKLDGVQFQVSNNAFGRFNFKYSEVYTGWTSGNTILSLFYVGDMRFQNNKWDGSGGKTRFWRAENKTGPVEDIGNGIDSVQNVQFVDYFADNFDFNSFDGWAASSKLGGSTVNIVYQVGDWVGHQSRFYKCIKENSGIEPGVTANWQNYWELQLFNNGKSFYPADDVRLRFENSHNKLKRGLLDNPTGSSPPPNAPPTAQAGPDITLSLPATETTLNGSGKDLDGTITSYQWTKISGPGGLTIVNPGLAQTKLSGLSEGIYSLQLEVTDNLGAKATDTLRINVIKEQSNPSGSNLLLTKLFPNPTTGPLHLYLKGGSQLQKLTLQIIGMNGAMLHTRDFSSLPDIITITLDTSTYTKGTYILRLLNNSFPLATHTFIRL